MTNIRGENRLIALAEKGKPCRQSVSQAVRDDMETIEKARGKGFSWAEISEALGFPDKWREIQRAYSRERRRAKKEKEVIPEQKTEKRIGVERIEEKKELPGSARPVSTGVTGTGKRPTDSKDPEPSGSGWREIKY